MMWLSLKYTLVKDDSTVAHATCLEALPVDNGGTSLIILLLGDPHLLEGGQGGHNGATNPDTVPELRRSDDLDLHGGWGHSCDLLLYPVGHAREHGVTSGQDDVRIQVLPDFPIASHDGAIYIITYTVTGKANVGRSEQWLWTLKLLTPNGDILAIGKLIALLHAGALGSSVHLLLKVQGHIAQLLLDVTSYFVVSSACETVATFCYNLGHVVGEVTTSYIQTRDFMGKGITFIDRYHM